MIDLIYLCNPMIKNIQHQQTQIWFGTDLNEKLNTLLKSDFSDCKKVIITDDNVFDLWIENLISSTEELHDAEIIELPAGENQKTIEICNQVWETLSDYKIGREGLIINFGGGVITDMGGFIASTFKRGLNFINIPTTLLSQVDASVGGKTGIDLGPLKNQIGVFSHPKHVLIDYKYLTTLPHIELKSGFAEMLKHGLIASEKHWDNLIQISEINADKVSPFIYESVQIKHQIVTADPKEKNERKSLNFGHTIGHAFEGFLLKKGSPAPHGFAVAWGMTIEAQLSHGLDADALKIIKSFIQNMFAICPISKSSIPELLELMKNDKKNEKGNINFTLLIHVGKSLINQNIETEELLQVLDDYLD